MTASPKSYGEKLRDPRWQRKRLEVMDRAGFRCELCGSTDDTLNVHHQFYEKGIDPWQYNNSDLDCLCEYCHKEKHADQMRLIRAVSKSRLSVSMIIGFCDGVTGSTRDMKTIPLPVDYVEGFAKGRAEVDLADGIDAAYACEVSNAD